MEIHLLLSSIVLLHTGPDTIRGGDTSLFSLPEESLTPHTSNLSMATTITSKPPSPPNNISNNTSFRRTVDILGSLVQKLSLACQKLVVDPSKNSKKVTAQTIIRATEEMKRIYSTIMTIPNCDLILFSDAFYPTSIMPPLIRTVSLDEDATGEGGPPQVCVSPRVHGNDHEDKDDVGEPRLNLLNSFDDFVNKQDGPQPNRIMMDDEYYYEDDLRRTVGSNDYEDSNNDTRDLPPDEDHEEQRDATSHRQLYHQTPQKQPCKI
jgi:hypothetical protein